MLKTLILIISFSIPVVAQNVSRGDRVITKEGYYYKFVSSDSDHYRIKWGNKSQSHISDKVFQLISWGLLFAESSDDAILLTQSCCTSCRTGVLLLENGLVREYDLLRNYDMPKNLIAFVPEEGSALIRVENFKTKKGITLDGVDLCPAISKGDCIESSSFTDKGFYIIWQGNKWRRGKPDVREKIIELTNLLN